MRTSRIVSLVGLLGAVLASGYGAEVTAQGALRVGGRRATYGKRTLSPGFTPDPVHITVVSGGPVSTAGMNLGPGCVGYVMPHPDFILTLRGASPNLRLYVTSGADTTLLVKPSDGDWICGDDSYGGVNPTVNIPNAPAGQYDIWVGSYQAGVQADSQLHITELDFTPCGDQWQCGPGTRCNVTTRTCEAAPGCANRVCNPTTNVCRCQ